MQCPSVRNRSRLVGLVLVTAWAGLASAEPPGPPSPPGNMASGSRPSVCENLSTQALQGYKVPGRKPDSQMPWEIFLGNASHRLIAYIYGTRYPANVVYYNNYNIKRILREQGIGDWSLLSAAERDMRPDITDVSARELFEIKPYNEKGLQEGSQEVQSYLRVLNRTALPAERFAAGKTFEGEILIQFAQGQYIWRLEWCTTTPGVTLYHWTRSREHFESNAAAYEAAQWVEISEQELKKYGGWVAQTSEAMVERRERLTTLSSALGVAIEVVGQVAMLVISTTTSGGERSTAQQGAKVLPFPSSPSPAASPVRLPKASGM
jgi:hypothetical protein